MEKWDIVCQQCGAYILTEEKDNCGEIHCIGGSYESQPPLRFLAKS